MNAVEIEAAISELALQPFDPYEFPYLLLAACGNKDTALKRLRSGNNNSSDIKDGVLLRNNIHIGISEVGAVSATLDALRTSPATAKAKAKFILATDGQTLEAEDLIGGEAFVNKSLRLQDEFDELTARLAAIVFQLLEHQSGCP